MDPGETSTITVEKEGQQLAVDYTYLGEIGPGQRQYRFVYDGIVVTITLCCEDLDPGSEVAARVQGMVRQRKEQEEQVALMEQWQ